LTGHIHKMLPELRRAGLDPVASVTLSRLIGDLREMSRFLEDLDFAGSLFPIPSPGCIPPTSDLPGTVPWTSAPQSCMSGLLR